MIFATIGTQLPFPRLIGWLDRLAGETGETIIAQTGDDTAAYAHIEARPWLEADEFDACLGRADRIVAHAGVGSLLKALRAEKPVVLVPRVARLGEHRNDHQMATAHQFAATPGVHVAESFEALASLLGAAALDAPGPDAPSPARAALIGSLKQTIADWAR